MKVKIGLVGCGGIMNGAHVPSFNKLKDAAEVVACCDLIEERALKTAARLGGTARVYANYKEMLSKEALDAVYVAIHPGAHEEATIEEDAVAAGCHLFVEKPLGVTIEKAKSVNEAISKAGVISAVGFHWRYYEGTDYLKKIIGDQTIAMVLGYYMANFPTVWWWRQRQTSGGQLHEQTTHIVDLCRYLAGDFDSVYSLESTRLMGDVENFDVSDSGIATFRLKSGAIGSITSTCVIEHGWDGYQIGLRIILKDRVLEHNGSSIKIIDAGKITEIKSEVNPYFTEDKTFLESVASGDPSRIRSPYSDALKTHEFTLMAAESFRLGKEIKL